MKPVRYFAATAAVGLLAVAGIAGAVESPLDGSNSPGVGGAGAFIAPAHVNGPFGSGGPCAGLGGAARSIPQTRPDGCG